ncbi:MAG TPA: ABC transporter ATP-binding protein [Acidobacteriota bacterium]|nr:ABC transporter ATP-binding protein [Acidobacteriota bacterium]
MLEARGLFMWYSGVPVLNGVSFALKGGEVTGYLGPNGAGKSTTVRILTGLVQPSEGRVFWNGQDINRCPMEYKARLGYVPEEPLIYPFLTGCEYLQLVGRLRGIPERILAQKTDALMNLFSLRRYRHTALSSYSKGMQQKVLLAAALLHNPDILILDEPLSGLDVTSSLIVRNLIASLSLEGKVILFSSHILELVEKVCSRVIILHRGSLVADGSVESLRDLMNLSTLEDVFSQLVIHEDTRKIAGDIVDVMKFN